MEAVAVGGIERPPKGGSRGAARADPGAPVPALDRDFLEGHSLGGPSPADQPDLRNPSHPPQPDPLRHRELALASHARTNPSAGLEPAIDRATVDALRIHLNIYPASEKSIREVERGRSCNAILPMPPGRSLSAGDSVVFTLAYSPEGQEMRCARGGDSVRVLLTGVTDLGTTDPATGRALVRLCWEPLGQEGPSLATAQRVMEFQSSHG